ncbi:hypothetical protein [Paenibacillus curdlanolyticus]|nr:hypothetical protein [Paenibacillus curdlanolyticus]
MGEGIMLITAITNLAIALINAWMMVQKRKDADRGNDQHPKE